MEPITDHASTLHRASAVCENCSCPLTIVDDAIKPLREHANRHGELGPHVVLREGEGVFEDSVGLVQDADQLQCPASDAFVVLPSVGESPRALPHTFELSSKDKHGGIGYSTALPSTVKSVDARIKQLTTQAAGGNGWEVLHPVCSDCLDTAIAELEPASVHEKRLIRKYEKALKRLERTSIASSPAVDTSTALSNIQKLDEEEECLLNEISSLELLIAHKEKEKLEVMADLAELHMWHVEFWLLFSSHSLRAMRHEERKRAMERLFAYVSQELQRLKRINVVNDAFHIWTLKFLPSINNCRIGRISSPSCPSWSEVNTGWGYLCLLLDVFYRKCHTQPSNYRLVPRGQFSFLIRKKDGVVLPLHGGGGEVGLSRFFYSNKRFDAAMTSFLECVKELFDRLLKSANDRGGEGRASFLLPIPELPYDIDGPLPAQRCDTSWCAEIGSNLLESVAETQIDCECASQEIESEDLASVYSSIKTSGGQELSNTF